MTELTVRRAGAVAALVAALLYLAIGLGVVTISTDVSANSDIFGFGALMAAVYVGLALLLLRSGGRVTLLVVAIVQAVTLVGYVAVASIRTPPFEAVGLTIKLLQLVILLAVAYVALRGPGHDQRVRARILPPRR